MLEIHYSLVHSSIKVWFCENRFFAIGIVRFSEVV